MHGVSIVVMHALRNNFSLLAYLYLHTDTRPLLPIEGICEQCILTKTSTH
jgi:hypothetical protein